MDRPFVFETNCIGSDYESIHPMVEQGRLITWRTFSRHVSWEKVQEVIPSYSYRGELYNPKTGELTVGFHIKDDWSVGFWKSRYRGRRCYYITWSGYEWVFTDPKEQTP